MIHDGRTNARKFLLPKEHACRHVYSCMNPWYYRLDDWWYVHGGRAKDTNYSLPKEQ